MQPRSSARVALIALLAGASGIGFAPVLVRLSEVGPSATAFYRVLFALPLLWLWAGLQKARMPNSRQPATPRDFWSLAIAGLFFTADLAIWHWSLQFTSVANSTVLSNFAPLFVTLGACLLLGERISVSFIIGMMFALGGAITLVGTKLTFRSEHLLGDTLAIITALFYAGYLLSVKFLRRSFSTATIMSWSGLVSCPGFFLVALFSGEKLVPTGGNGWLVLVALAILSHVGGQTLIAYAFGHLSASFSSLSLFLQPAIAAMVAWFVLKEPVGMTQGIGGLVILAGIAIASRSERAL